MTRENRVLLSLDEIRSLRWECSKCHAAISYQLDQTIRLPQKCPACREQVPTDVATVQAEQVLMNFVDALKAAIRITEKQFPATISLEFVEDRGDQL